MTRATSPSSLHRQPPSGVSLAALGLPVTPPMFPRAQQGSFVPGQSKGPLFHLLNPVAEIHVGEVIKLNVMFIELELPEKHRRYMFWSRLVRCQQL